MNTKSKLFKVFALFGLASSVGMLSATPLAIGGESAAENFDVTSHPVYQEDRSERLWYGVAPAAVLDALDAFGPEVEKYPDLFADVALAYDRQTVIVSTISPDRARKIGSVADLLNKYGDQVSLRKVQYSYSDLESARDAAVERLGDIGLVSAGISPIENTVKLEVEPGSQAENMLKTESSRSAISNKSEGDSTSSLFKVQLSSPIEFASGRENDYERFFMGGAILSDSGERCSLGLPVIVEGKKGVLTAGHCTGKRFTTPTGKFVGSQYTTTFPGNAKLYGDWKILVNATYAPNIFNTPPRSSGTSNLRIAGVTDRKQGAQVCVSGATTGQTCRYFVEDPDTTFTSKGVKVANVSRFYHDENFNGWSDCKGIEKGDSGGPVYSATGREGKVNVHGIVSAREENLFTCRYYFTRFDGVTKWDRAIRVAY